MGIFNSFGAKSGQFAARQERAQVAGALAKELQRSGRMQTILQMIEQNTPAHLMKAWTGGQTETMVPAELQQSLAGTGLQESLSKDTNMPPGVVRASLLHLLPHAILFLSQAGHIGENTHPGPERTFNSTAFLAALTQVRQPNS